MNTLNVRIRPLILLLVGCTLLFVLFIGLADALGQSIDNPAVLFGEAGGTNGYSLVDVRRTLNHRLTPVQLGNTMFYMWSTDGRYVAVFNVALDRCGESRIYVIDTASGRVDTAMTDNHTFIRCATIRWSPDNTHLAFELTRDGQFTAIGLLDVATATLHEITDYDDYIHVSINGRTSGPRWSPTGDAVLFDLPVPSRTPNIARHWQPHVLDIGSGDLYPLPVDSRYPDSAAWLGDSGLIGYVAREDDGLYFLTMDVTGAQVADLTTILVLPSGWLYRSPDGRYVAFQQIVNRRCCTLTVSDVMTGMTRIYGELVATTNSNLHVDWSPDSRYFTYVNETGTQVEMLDMTTREARVVGDIEAPTAIHRLLLWWSPDSRYLAFRADDREMVYFVLVDIATDRVLYREDVPRADIAIAQSVGWTPDSRYISLADSNPITPTIRVLDATRGAVTISSLNYPLLPVWQRWPAD